MQSSGMTAGCQGLMQIWQASNNRTACPSAACNQHAHLAFEQFRVDAVSFHGQLPNGRFPKGSGEYLGRIVDLDYGRLPQ